MRVHEAPLKRPYFHEFTATIDYLQKHIKWRFVPKGGAFTLTIEKTDGNTTVLNYDYKISNTQLNPDFDALGAFKINIPNGLPVQIYEVQGKN